MRRLLLLITVGLLTGCASRAVRKELTVVTNAPNYFIAQKSPTVYLIWAESAAAAQEAVKIKLNCGEDLCAIAPSGVFYTVEKLNRQACDPNIGIC
jgi:hypothetical protein